MAESRRAWVGLGANLDDPPGRLRDALQRVADWPGIELLRQSSFYRSKALGPAPQPDYCNAVCLLRTKLPPRRLLQALLMIEQAMGRARGPERWSARAIDLDLLHYEGVASDGRRLTLPHPELARRNFVLAPLAEVSPDLEIPGLGRIAALAEAAGQEGLSLWSPS